MFLKNYKSNNIRINPLICTFLMTKRKEGDDKRVSFLMGRRVLVLFDELDFHQTFPKI